jgi:Protein of unknown function (DUF3040)
MPLSEQEQRLLDEMERNLYQNDADFVATVGPRRPRSNYRSVVIGVLIGVLGIITLIVGVGIHLAVVGVLGFLIMFAGVLIAATPPRATKPAAGSTASPSARAKSRSGGFMSSLNDRWERRQDDRDR